MKQTIDREIGIIEVKKDARLSGDVFGPLEKCHGESESGEVLKVWGTGKLLHGRRRRLELLSEILVEQERSIDVCFPPGGLIVEAGLALEQGCSGFSSQPRYGDIRPWINQAVDVQRPAFELPLAVLKVLIVSRSR